MPKTVCLIFFCFIWAGAVQAQLSSNPWAEENSEEEVVKVYKKRQRMGLYDRQQDYNGEDSVVIDRTHAYIQEDEPEEKSGSFFERIKNSFKGEESNNTKAPLIPNTAENRKKMAMRKSMKQNNTDADTGDSDSFFSMPKMPGLNFGKSLSGLKNKFGLPKLNATQTIQQLEKASGLDFKSIAKKMK